MRYSDYKCDGCGRVFQNDDDIVVCPECATPQHRECYKEKGGCVNAHLHAEGFQWQGEKQLSEKPVQVAEEKKETAPDVFNLNSTGLTDDTPEWIKAVKNTTASRI